jgi:hypothetical protein
MVGDGCRWCFDVLQGEISHAPWIIFRPSERRRVRNDIEAALIALTF